MLDNSECVLATYKKVKRTAMSSCKFCKIVRRQAPASIAYEDDVCMGFSPLRPIHPDEVVLIPKNHIDHFIDLPDSVAAHLIVVAQKIGRRVMEVFRPQRIGYVVHGFGVPHAHFMVVPQHSPDDIVSARYACLVDGRIEFREEKVARRPREELDAIVAKIFVEPLGDA